MTKKSIYIAGPMTGLPEFNYPAFFMAEHILARDWLVNNPARMDGIDTTGMKGLHSEVPEFCLKQAMKRNCHAICESDAIYMLKGWEKSRGAMVEIQLAIYLGLEIHYER
jgi:hypothetical protein